MELCFGALLRPCGQIEGDFRGSGIKPLIPLELRFFEKINPYTMRVYRLVNNAKCPYGAIEKDASIWYNNINFDSNLNTLIKSRCYFRKLII